MKKYTVAIIALLLLPLCCSCVARKATNKGYTLYRSSPVGVEIEYPSFWEMAEDKKEKAVAFATPTEDLADTYRDNVSVCSYRLDETDEMAFDRFVSGYIDKLPSTVNGYKLISEGGYAVGEYDDAYRVVYEGTTDEGDLRLQQTFISSGRYAYIFSFIAEPKSYDYFDNNAQVMLSTFRALMK